MTASGLEDVADPSMLFLSARHVDGGGDEVRQMVAEASTPHLCVLKNPRHELDVEGDKYFMQRVFE